MKLNLDITVLVFTNELILLHLCFVHSHQINQILRMEILDLISDAVTNVPISYGDTKDFRKLIFSKLSRFKELIDSAEKTSSHPFLEHHNVFTYKRSIEKLIDGLLLSIDNFYEGKPAKAYSTFSETMNSLDITEYLDKNSLLPCGSNLYRMRNAVGNYPLTIYELFHIPFEKRGLVQSQRFSIPGLPSLYTANSIYVAWEEMRRPNVDTIQAIRLVNQRDIKLLDITTDIYNNNSEINTDNPSEILYKLLIWPLVACCSVKVKNINDTFKPEYIIPQLLLQWSNKNLDGIKYSSTHIDLNNTKHKGTFYNVVLPVKTFNVDKGYCRHLKRLFKSTNVLPMQLRQISTIIDRFSHQSSIRSDINLNIEELELIEGTAQSYSQTLFGILEHGLSGIDIHSL